MIDCNTLYGCSEGYWTKGWKQIQTDRYAALEANRPYLADKDETRCLRETDNGLTDIMQIGSYQVHREEDDEETMIGFLATYGPIVVAVLVDDTLYWYGSAISPAVSGPSQPAAAEHCRVGGQGYCGHFLRDCLRGKTQSRNR